MLSSGSGGNQVLVTVIVLSKGLNIVFGHVIVAGVRMIKHSITNNNSYLFNRLPIAIHEWPMRTKALTSATCDPSFNSISDFDCRRLLPVFGSPRPQVFSSSGLLGVAASA